MKKKKKKRIIKEILDWVIWGMTMFFVFCGVFAVVFGIIHKVKHSKEITITSSQIEQLVEQKESLTFLLLNNYRNNLVLTYLLLLKVLQVDRETDAFSTTSAQFRQNTKSGTF